MEDREERVKQTDCKSCRESKEVAIHPPAGCKQQVGDEDLLYPAGGGEIQKISENSREENQKDSNLGNPKNPIPEGWIKEEQKIEKDEKGQVHEDMDRQGSRGISGGFPHCVLQYFHQKRLPSISAQLYKKY